MHFVGITRFNLVTPATLGHFNSTAKLTLPEAKAHVYQPEKLRIKLDTFEHFCIPTYRALSADTRSHGLVLISHDLPQPFKDEVEALCASVPRLHVVEFADDDTLRGRIDPILARIGGEGRVFNYRYDDDDLLSADFLTDVDSLCADVPTGTVVSMNKGFVVGRLGADSYGAFENLDPLNAYGLGMVVDATEPRNIFDVGPHDKVKDSVAHNTSTPSWIAFRHGLNDSQSNVSELKRLKQLQANARSGAETVTVLAGHIPHLDLEALQILPVLSPEANLEAIARRAIRRTRVLEKALKVERQKNVGHGGAGDIDATDLLQSTRAALASARKQLSEIKGSRSFKLGRAIATTRSLRSVMTLPQRAWAATRR
jgi:hypothetical protein